ncbi:MAG: small ribosomal subunit Rsm22 family protein, partial [Alphaproteobacteria bacterium]|nr:small ribosomal subunit Rsm22 family protein [Alphaproteobacteria bacterium]
AWQARLDEKALEGVDISVASYSLGEVQESLRKTIVSELWKQSRYGMIIIEPGTPQGFSVIRSLRAHLIDEGAMIQAPCTHEQACPMAPKDWCHFKLNCKRPSFLKQAKNSTLGYEEENYSYVVAVKASEISKEAFSTARPYGRVVRPILKRSGHVSLDLCTQTGLERITMSKKEGDLYKESRKLSLGDAVQQDISRTNDE